MESCSYDELLEWADLWKLSPRGPWRDDLRIAQLCALLANVNRDPKQKPEPFGVDDFMPKFEAAVAAEQAKPEAEGYIEPRLTAWLFAMARRNEKRKDANADGS